MNPSTLGVWLTFLGVLVTGSVSAFNAWQNHEIQQQQAVLSSRQVDNGFVIDGIRNELAKREQDLGRLKFVKELLPDAMSTDGTRRATFLTLVQLTLTDAEYRSLVAALSTSQNPQLQEVGKTGQETLDQVDQAKASELIRLVELIKDPDKSKRLVAMDALYATYMSDKQLTRAVVDYLGSAQDEPLHVQGRINALYLLTGLDSGAWTPELIEGAQTAVQRVEAAAKSNVGPPLGPQTTEVMEKVKIRLKSLGTAT